MVSIKCDCKCKMLIFISDIKRQIHYVKRDKMSSYSRLAPAYCKQSNTSLSLKSQNLPSEGIYLDWGQSGQLRNISSGTSPRNKSILSVPTSTNHGSIKAKFILPKRKCKERKHSLN